MKQNKVPIIIIFILLLTTFAIMVNVYHIQKDRNTLVIGLISQQNKLMSSSMKLELDSPYQVRFVTFNTELELLQAVYSNKVDLYIIDSYSYIKQFAKLPSSKAIFGVPTDYYLISLTDQAIKRPRVGMLNDSISEHLLSGKAFSKLIYNDYKDCLQDLYAGLIDQAVLQKDYVDSNKFKVLSKLSSLGITEDLIIISTEWLEKNDEEDLAIIKKIAALFKNDLKKPDEKQLIDVMTELFTNESISTRYYYKDLVYTNGL